MTDALVDSLEKITGDNHPTAVFLKMQLIVAVRYFFAYFRKLTIFLVLHGSIDIDDHCSRPVGLADARFLSVFHARTYVLVLYCRN